MGILVPALPRQTIAQTLGGLNPSVLILLLGSFSRAVNVGMVRSRALAAALQVAGARRLGSLQSVAPRVRVTLDKLMSRLPNVHLNVEEIAIVRAIIEFYLGLIFQLLEADDHRPRPSVRPLIHQRNAWPHFLFVPVSRSHRIPVGVLLPPSLTVL